MAQFCGVCGNPDSGVKPETQLLFGDGAKNMPDSPSARTRLHLKLRWGLQSGDETELAFWSVQSIGTTQLPNTAPAHALPRATAPLCIT